MKRNSTVRRSRIAAAAILSVAAFVPALASATSIQLSGTVNDISTSRNGSPFSIGDTLSGSFDANLQGDNSFGKADVSNFNLAVGPASYSNLDGTQFAQFNGQLSSDGSTVTSILINNTGFGSVPGLDNAASVTLGGFDPQTFTITAAGSSSTPFGAYTVTGDFNAVVAPAQGQNVPEPSTLGFFGLGAILMGCLAFRRKQSQGSA